MAEHRDKDPHTPDTTSEPETVATPAAPPSPAPAGPAGWRRWAFPIAATVLIPALILGALELGLRLAGYGVPPNFFVPNEGANADAAGELTTNPRFGWRFFPPTLARAPVVTTLAAAKPPGTIRIYVLGGSAAMGTPEAAFGFGRVLQAMLDEAWPEVRFEVVNAAMTAVNSHVVLPIARECADLEPDLFLVYLGNNEVVGPYGPGTVFAGFTDRLTAIRAGTRLRATRTGQLLGRLTGGDRAQPLAEWEGLEMFADRRVAADDPRLEKAYAHFETNLRDILRAGTAAGARVLVSTVATNLLDNPPFASDHRSDLGEEDLRRWQELYDRATERLTGTSVGEEEIRAAVQALERAREIDDEWAELHFLLGHGYRALGRDEEAAAELVLARDLDTLRFRADSRINAAIRALASGREDEGVYLLDGENEVGGTPLGASSEVFWEHVHLNLEGNYRLAQAVFEQLPAIFAERLATEGSAPEPPSRQRVAELLALTDWDRQRMAATIRDMVARPPFTEQFGHRLRLGQMRLLVGELLVRAYRSLNRSEEIYQRALEAHPDDLPIRANYAALLGETGRDADAVEQWDRLLERVPGMAEWRTERAFALAAQAPPAEGEPTEEARKLLDEAVAELRAVLEEHPEAPRARINLGTVLEQRGDLEEAAALYRDTAELYPGYDVARFNLANVLVRQEDLDGAAALYREALQKRPDAAPLHGHLGGVLERLGDPEAAASEYRKALELDPDLAGVRNNLGYLLERQGRRRDAAEAYATAIQADPTFPLPYFNLADLLLEQGIVDRAIRAYRTGLDLSPTNLQARYNLALALGSTGEEVGAAVEFDRILGIAPGHPGALSNLAWILATTKNDELRDPQGAIQLARRALEVAGREPQILETLARAQQAAGNRREARDTADEALEAARAKGDEAYVTALRKRLGDLLR